MNLKYEDLVKIEGNFLKPTLEKVRKAIQTIFEGKTTRLVGSDFDKKIVFFVDKDLKTAQFEVNEDKVKIHSIDEVSVDSESFGQKFTSLMSEAIDLLSENKEVDSKSKFNDAIEVLRRNLSGDKTTIFDKRPPLCEHKVSVRKIKILKENKKQIIKDLAKNLNEIMEGYYGKDVIKNSYYEVSLNEGKSNEVRTFEKEPSLLRKVDLAKKSAKSVDMKPIFENVQNWISENEEVFFLTSDKFKERLIESSKTNVSATKDKINEAVRTFVKMRSENAEFKKLANQILREQTTDDSGINEPEIGNDREPDRDDLDDKVVSDVDRKSDEDKLGFMRQFVDILEKLLTKIKEVSDDEEIQRRVDFAVETILKAKEEQRWDKDELAEIAKEAIELAAKVEGIEPIDTEISKRSEEEDSEAEMDRETISGTEGGTGEVGSSEVGMEPEIGGEEEFETPGEERAEHLPGGEEEGGEEEEFRPRKKVRRELTEELDVDNTVISPDGDISFGDDEEGLEGIDIPTEMEKLTCYGCEKDFSVEGGNPSYNCPYCGEDVDGFGVGDPEVAALSKAEYNPHPAEEELEEVPVSEDDGMGNADQSSVNEASKMSTNPAVGKITDVGGTELSDSGPKMSNKPKVGKMEKVVGSTEGIIDKSGAKMATNPAVGSQTVVDGTKLPTGGKKMSKNPKTGKMEYVDGTKLPDSGKKMSKNPAVGKQEVVKGSTGEISDSGEKMSTHPKVGKIETLKEGVPSASKNLTAKKFGKALPKEDIFKGKKDDTDIDNIDDTDDDTGGGDIAPDTDVSDIDPAGASAPEADVAPVDVDAEAPVDMGTDDTEAPVDTDISVGMDTEAPVDTDIPVDTDTDTDDVSPIDTDIPVEVGAVGVDISVGGTDVDVAGGASQTSGKLPDTGEQMSTNPPVGEVETLGEEGQPPTSPVANCPTCGGECGDGECAGAEEAGVSGDMNTPPIELEGCGNEGCGHKKLKDKKALKLAREDIKKIRESIEAEQKPKCNSCSKETTDLYEDPKTWGPMSNAGQGYLCLECMRRDFPYMVKKEKLQEGLLAFAKAHGNDDDSAPIEETEQVNELLKLTDTESASVFNPRTQDDACKYGKGTNWCIAAKGSRNYFNSYFYGRGIELYIVISKENPKEKYAIAVAPDGTKEMFDAQDGRVEDMEGTLAKFGLDPKTIGKPQLGRQDNQEWLGDEADIDEGSYLPKDATVNATYGSKSNPDRKYYIVKGKDGVTYCTCPAWKFSKDQPKCCKHLSDYTGGGSGRVTDENNEEFIREANSPAIDPEV